MQYFTTVCPVHGRRKGVREGQGPLWILKISAKKVVILVLSRKEQILPLLSPPRKIFRKAPSDPLEKNSFDAHASVLHVITTASDFNIMFVFFLSEYLQKHDRASGNPNQRTLLSLARLSPPTKTPF